MRALVMAPSEQSPCPGKWWAALAGGISAGVGDVSCPALSTSGQAMSTGKCSIIWRELQIIKASVLTASDYRSRAM